ncbi:hypothetical protein ACF0H5_008435 [Mactra antiquata]
MTKSAPPERTPMSGRMDHGHVSRRRTHYKSTKQSDVSISVGDIYQCAERERLTYSAAVRRQNLAQAQSQTQFFRQGSPISRPNTSASKNYMVLHRETNTPYSTWSEPVLSRPSSIVPHPELRHLVETEDNSDEEDDDMAHRTPMTVTFSSPSRDCCEIIGPQLCYECRKNRIRQVSRERSDYFFPTLEPSEENLTTAAIVRKYLPGLSEQEVEDKIARGEIARPSMKKVSKHVDFSDEEDDVKSKVSSKKVTIAPTEKDIKRNTLMHKKSSSELFFTNVRDLNYKIITGSADRNVGFKNQTRQNTEKKTEDSSSSTFFPTFVSPRKVKMVQETNYKTYFEPPLIEKAKQDVEPQFFAGSTGEYSLPEKLPDELVFVDKDGNSIKASSSQSFTLKESAVTEGKTKSTDGGNQTKEKEADLEILKEDEEEEEGNSVDHDADKYESLDNDNSINSDDDNDNNNNSNGDDNTSKSPSSDSTKCTDEDITKNIKELSNNAEKSTLEDTNPIS